MERSIRILFVACSLGMCATAVAQTVDGNQGSPSAATPSSSAVPAAPAVRSTGSSKAVLVPFGPFVTQTGVGAGGADVSEVYDALGYYIYGYGMQDSVTIHVADDFTVPTAETWSVSNIRWLSYQTGASTTGTITSLNLNLWNSNPEGQTPGGQFVTGGNQFVSQTWTGVYRVYSSTLTAFDRAIIQVSCGAAWVPNLGQGNYWIEAYAGGTLTLGPWAPIKTKAGQVPPTGDPWNGLQSVSNGAFAQVFDTGGPTGSIHEPGDFLWQVEGVAGACCSATFCTSKTSSLGCTPTLSSNSAFANKNGSGLTQLTAVPVPGGSFLPGILVYSKSPPIAPISTAYGFLCLASSSRAGAAAATPGGVAGTCSGAYVWNMTAIANGTPSILVGDQLYLQGWYRDPGFAPPGNANYTDGIGPIGIQ